MLRPLMAQRMVTTASIMMMIIIVIECYYYYNIMAEVSFLKLNDRNLETHQVEIAARSRWFLTYRARPLPKQQRTAAHSLKTIKTPKGYLDEPESAKLQVLDLNNKFLRCNFRCRLLRLNMI